MKSRLSRMLLLLAVVVVVLAQYGCSQAKDNSGNGSGVYYSGPMQPKGKLAGEGKGG